MKFKHGTRRRANEYEKDLVKQWKANKTFEKSVNNRSADKAYVFYDGPPFITGVPHHGTLLSSIVKDAIPRYWTMKGYRVERVWGWDCHGLPAEVFTEKKLGIQDKRDIGTTISLENYITTCRDNMVQTGGLWEDTIDRIGRWVDFKGAYKTMDKEYMESVWWAFKTLYEKGKIYEGEKVLMYCTRDATPISKAEVAMDNSYQVITDPSVYVKFKLTNGSIEKLHNLSLDTEITELNLIAWTTTPWTLNANTALAINRDVLYQVIESEGSMYLVAENLVSKVFVDEKHQPLNIRSRGIVEGRWLEGLEYEPLFADRGENAHRIWHADFVHDEEGTGIAHEAPAYGEDDYDLSKKSGFPMVLDTDEEGYYTEGPWKGMQIWGHNKQIAKDLKEQGVVWKIDYIQHDYPHCHRCGTKLQYRAHPSWFMDIEGQRTEMLEQNEPISWFPEHIKNGRFEKTVESAPDWNLSRDRFWATAMPVWKGTDSEGKEHIKVVGSYAELKDLSGVELEDYHRPWIDDVTFEIDGVRYARIDKVMDCWFESGSMPFAQFHYPFENVEKFEKNFPGDFIAEYVGQVRAWFYYLHAVNVGLFGKNAFKNVIVTGTLAGNDGRKMSKSFGNYTDPNELMNQYSADSLRFLLLGSPVLNGEDYSLQDKDVYDVARKLSMVWNMYDFFTMYAEVDGWDSESSEAQQFAASPLANAKNPLDVWILSRLHQLAGIIEDRMDSYDIPNSVKPILEFLDDASNWYVRRSRRRFWKSEDDSDKNEAYATLHYVLTKLSILMAPFTPFLAEELYQKLTGGESVHLLDWPTQNQVDQEALDSMAKTRKIIEHGLGLRMQKSETESSIKVRQPLQSLSYTGTKLSDELEQIILEEVNVKEIKHSNPDDQDFMCSIDKSLTKELILEGKAREIIRLVQSARKDAGLNVDDRINLSLKTDSEDLQASIKTHKETIMSETLATQVSEADYGFKVDLKADGEDITISIEKS